MGLAFKVSFLFLQHREGSLLVVFNLFNDVFCLSLLTLATASFPRVLIGEADFIGGTGWDSFSSQLIQRWQSWEAQSRLLPFYSPKWKLSEFRYLVWSPQRKDQRLHLQICQSQFPRLSFQFPVEQVLHFLLLCVVHEDRARLGHWALAMLTCLCFPNSLLLSSGCIISRELPSMLLSLLPP